VSQLVGLAQLRSRRSSVNWFLKSVSHWGTWKRENVMLIVLLALLVLILFGAGFAVHLLWIAAVVLAVVWVASFALSRGEGASRRSLRR
jgi:hypothetical protein